MHKYLLGILIGLILGLIIKSGLQFVFPDFFSSDKNNWEVKEKDLSLKIDSLKKENDSLLLNLLYQDSLLLQIENNYEKESNTLLNQPIECQYSFFSEYLDKYSWGHDSCNNAKTATNY